MFRTELERCLNFVSSGRSYSKMSAYSLFIEIKPTKFCLEFDFFIFPMILRDVWELVIFKKKIRFELDNFVF